MTRQKTSTPRPKRRWLRAVKIGVATVLMMLIGLVAIPIVSPEAGAAIADGLRSVIGPDAVAQIESVSFQLEDIFNRARYQISGGQSQLSWADPSTSVAGSSAITNTIAPTATPRAPTASVPTGPKPPAVQPVLNVINAPSFVDTSWQAFGPTINGAPLMARASVQPDPARPYAAVALVRIDLSQVQLHLMPGTVEPVAARGVPAFARPGLIPAGDQSSGQLLAAFNGGFKAVHGRYGMQTETGVTILPPQDGLATLALYRDGSVRLGAWGRDILLTPDLVGYRQNCPLLIDEGQINPQVNDDSRKEWGYTIKNLDTTWRSGVGLSRDGRFLIYAAGNSLTVESLARALQQAGAYYAMQLDINGFYTRFVTYVPNPASSGFPVIAHKLLNEMTAPATQFLTPYNRDFFYLMARSKM
jgi:hypothetical protein